MQETIKVVASTNVWKDFGESADFPMWKSVGCNEYIIGYTNGIPTFEDIGKMVADLQHVLEGKIESNIIEVLSNDATVYVLHRSKDTEQTSDLPFEAVSMHRFTFDESGKVASIRNLSEDRFVLEQQGFTISR